MNRGERLAIMNGPICILNILKMLINPDTLKDKKLIEAAMKHIESTKKMLDEGTDE